MHGDAKIKRAKVKQKTIHAVDLFCGAGGTSTGLIDAVNGLGYAIKLTAINHWDVAIATHSKNHEDVAHYCQSIETINPTEIVPGGRLQLLVASPECTHHSRARGGKPRSDQKRADAWLLLRWIEKLYVENILIENVKEFVEWGPLTAVGKPDKRKKGLYFRQFIETLKINYNVDYRVLNCADYGDPTTRERLFILARRPNHKLIEWPQQSHANRKVIAKLKDQPNGHPLKSLKPWVAAREIIDWEIEGRSIFGRKKPLSDNTLRRIYAGLMKYSLKPFIVPQFSQNPPRDVDNPLGVITTTSRGMGLCESFVIGQQSGASPREVGEPVPTVAGKGAVALVEPFLMNLKGTDRRDRDIDEPTFTQAAHGNHQGVVEVEPFLIKNFSGSDESRSKSLDDPLGTVAANFNHHYLVEPFIVSAAHGGNTNPPRDIDEPLGSVLGSPKFGVCEPFIVPFFGEREGQEPRTRDINEPAPTVTTNNRMGLCEPFMVNMKGKSNARSIEEPTYTQTNKQHQYLAEPYIVKFYGNEKGAESIDDPLATVTAKDRFGLCIPSIGAVLDIRFRMLQPHELAAAMSFPKEYEFTGNREAKVKQIGNAVPLKTAAALCRALLT